MAKAIWGAARFSVQIGGAAPFPIEVTGRERWALEALIAAGSKGCAPFDHPGPRWSAYVHDLRKLGVLIEKTTERHGGEFPGNHARYCLACLVRRIGEEKAA
ncbi:hypothetical protein SAMN05877809_10578 [Rhodobacter sp. JA431]|uniref:winged helix domain-containing protein n=1 Tax=Rhodobacter sp. JA431 TaxID=570013 RepID=UPI000BC851A1|nr:hypothetical protein [Rhodobacter sp. JA431]SOC10168.1 hypothetical protein SAMN05877809_10578 [Rhodobacter sp. JA431]